MILGELTEATFDDDWSKGANAYAAGFPCDHTQSQDWVGGWKDAYSHATAWLNGEYGEDRPGP